VPPVATAEQAQPAAPAHAAPAVAVDAVAGSSSSAGSGGGSGGGSSGSKVRPTVCAGCGLEFPKLRKCAGCAAAGVYTGYCSEACQKAAWPVHKRECRARSKQRQQQQQ
jgi:hypothetical protein